MARPRRKIISGNTYEITFRTRFGLPFVCTSYVETILSSIIARVQRDEKVHLCHFVFMANHAHIIVVAKDALQCANFHGEVKKQITEAFKQLLGLPFLTLWNENATSVVEIGELEAAKERIAYLYANPARANLIDSIKLYPGLNSFSSFMSSEHTINAKTSSLCPWIRTPTISPIPKRPITQREDKNYSQTLRTMAKLAFELTLEPNLWMKTFGVNEESEVKKINQSICANLDKYEADARALRLLNGWKTKKESRLREETIDMTYIPSRDSKRIYIYVNCPKLRVELLKQYRYFCERCRYCYEQWKIGNYTVEWPPGAFQPPIPPRANWFEG
jgi:REP element-mobilizing transposase RayT